MQLLNQKKCNICYKAKKKCIFAKNKCYEH